MLILKSAAQIKNQIEKARQLKPLVRPVEPRRYLVRNSEGGMNRVQFLFVNGQRLATCQRPDATPCPANQHGLACVHVAASVGHHIVTMMELRARAVAA